MLLCQTPKKVKFAWSLVLKRLFIIKTIKIGINSCLKLRMEIFKQFLTVSAAVISIKLVIYLESMDDGSFMEVCQEQRLSLIFLNFWEKESNYYRQPWKPDLKNTRIIWSMILNKLSCQNLKLKKWQQWLIKLLNVTGVRQIPLYKPI